MTRRRFHAPPESFSPDADSVTLSAEETRHLRDVLRLKVDGKVYVFDGTGREFRCEVKKIGRNATELRVLNQVTPESPESTLTLTLAVALLKGEKFDLVVQKATELGVARIVPVITTRADVRIRGNEDTDRKTLRWQRIALEATKQCGRARLMTVETPISFYDLMKHSLESDELGVMFAERTGNSLISALDRAPPDSVVALIGSEGGWTDEEIAQARDTGWTIVTLGGRTLRAETAAIVAAALLQHRFGDLI